MRSEIFQRGRAVCGFTLAVLLGACTTVQQSIAEKPKTNSAADSLVSQVMRNWFVDPGDARCSSVRIGFSLNPDGTLHMQPTPLNKDGLENPACQLAVNSAVRAIFKTVPFDLPPDHPELVREEIILTFDPRGMLDPALKDTKRP